MTATDFDYKRISTDAIKAIRHALGENTAIVSEEGYRGRIHLKIVSDSFDGKGEREKQLYIWDIINADLDAEAQQAISFVLCYSIDEI